MMILAVILEDKGVDSLPLTWGLVTILCAAVGSTAFLTWFVRDQFSKQRGGFFKIISRHNREDDDRFVNLSDELWNLRAQVARLSGDIPPSRKTLPRRRYLVDDTNEEKDSDQDDG